jgi:predicted RNA-binding protein associated with RNAse of E/G family
MNKTITVIKLNHLRQETWRYSGRVLSREPERITIEAFFNRPDLPFHGILLAEGDRFVETYSTLCWYNIFEIHDRLDDHIKGWYCNVTLPAEINEDQVSYVDLALDLLVYPDGRQLVLDEDEFLALDLDADTQTKARDALKQLHSLVFSERLKQMFIDPAD